MMTTSKDLAILIVDALISANVLDKHHLDEAIAITHEEINARLAVSDGTIVASSQEEPNV